jgi:hypothetical protein
MLAAKDNHLTVLIEELMLVDLMVADLADVVGGRIFILLAAVVVALLIFVLEQILIISE